jgi:hypothetical protein
MHVYQKGVPQGAKLLFTPQKPVIQLEGSATFGHSCFDVWTWGLEGSVVTTLIYYEITHYHQIFTNYFSFSNKQFYIVFN